MKHFAIKREVTEFLGPLRCQPCISRDSECVVSRESKTCSKCSSESECLFARDIIMHKKYYTWEELNGEIPLTQMTSPRIHSQLSREGGNPMSLDNHRGQHAPSGLASASTAFVDRTDDPYLTGSPPDSSAHPAQLPMTGMRYNSPRLDEEDDLDSPLSPYGSAAAHSNDFSRHGSTQARDETARKDDWENRYPPMRSSARLPSIRDSLSHVDPQIAPEMLGMMPLTHFDDSGRPSYGHEKTQSPQRAQPGLEGEVMRSHDFVMEIFNTTSGSMETRRGKRRGKLSESSAASAHKLRSVGACWKCKLQKNQASIPTLYPVVILTDSLLV